MLPNQISKSLDNYAQFYQLFDTIPVMWDKTSKRLVCESRNHKLLLWRLLIVCIVALLGVSGCYFVVIRELLRESITIPIFVTFLTGGFAIMGSFCLSMALNMNQNSVDFVDGWNRLIGLEELLEKEYLAGPTENDRKCFKLGIILRIFARTFEIFPFIMIPAIVYLRVDPFTYYMEDLGITEDHDFRIIAQFIRWFLLTVCVIEAARQYPFLFILLFTQLSLLINCLDNLSRQLNYLGIFINQSIVDNEFIKFNQLTLIYSYVKPFSQCVNACLLTLILVLSVGFNFATMKFYSLVPLPFYLYIVAVSLMIPVILQLILLPAAKIHEKSSSFLKEWQFLSLRNGKLSHYNYKRFKACKPLSFDVTIGEAYFLGIRRSTRNDYYYTISNNTINLLVSVPQESLVRSGIALEQKFW